MNNKLRKIPKDGFRFHEVANIFPMMDKEALDELTQDIAENGLDSRIAVACDEIVDGRNRYKALCRLGMQNNRNHYHDLSKCFNWCNPADQTQFVLSRNLHRRHLTKGQKAEIGVRTKQVEAKLAKERQGTRTDLTDDIPENFPGCDARDKAATTLGISGRMIDHAEKVFGEDNTAVPELQQAVREGKASVSAAAKVATLQPEQQRQAVTTGKKGVAQAAKEALQYPGQERPHEIIPATTLQTKDMVKVYLHRDNPQLFAVELRGKFTKDYLCDCFDALKTLWNDTENSSSAADKVS